MFLFRWQLESLIEQLGPHASGFHLDEWAAELDSKQQSVILPSQRWGWIQAEFEKEVRKRGLPIGDTGHERQHWSERCPHDPRCGNATNCETLSIVAAARKARGQ